MPVTGKRAARGIQKRSCYLPRSFVCGGGGVTARGAGRFFAADFCFVSDFAFACFGSRFACFVSFLLFVLFCFFSLKVAWMLWCWSCSHACLACVDGMDLRGGLGGVACVAQRLQVVRSVYVSALDVVDVCGVCCAVGVVPPGAGIGGALGPVLPVPCTPPGRCEACAFSVCRLECLFSELVPVFWESRASVAGGPCHVSHGSGWAWVVWCVGPFWVGRVWCGIGVWCSPPGWDSSPALCAGSCG